MVLKSWCYAAKGWVGWAQGKRIDPKKGYWNDLIRQREMALDLGDDFHKGLMRLSKRVQITISQMKWEKEYIEDEIPEVTLRKRSGTQIVAWGHNGRICTEQKMRLRWNWIQILMPGLVTYINILFSCTQTNTTKVKQSNGKWNRVNCQAFQKVFVGPDFWLLNNCVFQASQNWDVTHMPPYHPYSQLHHMAPRLPKLK